MSTATTTSAEPATRVGTWRTLAGGRRMFVPVVVGNAVVQTLSVVSDPVPGLSVGFVAVTAVSTLAVLVAVWLTVCAASAAVDGVPRHALLRARQHMGVLGWALGILLLTAAAVALAVWLGAVVLVLGLFVLPAAATGERPVLVAGYRPVVRSPLRSALAVLAAVVAVVLSWMVALLLGFFVTGAGAAALTWLWFGLVTTVLLCLWCSLYAASSTRAP